VGDIVFDLHEPMMVLAAHGTLFQMGAQAGWHAFEIELGEQAALDFCAIHGYFLPERRAPGAYATRLASS
jgi:hypothetical protein